MNKVVSKILAQLFLCFNIIKATTVFQLRQSSKSEEKAQAIKKKQTGKQINFIRTFKINLKNAHLNREYTLFN